MFSSQKLCPIDAEILADVLSEWQTLRPEMGVLVLLPEAEKAAVPMLQKLCRDKDIPMLGAVFPALITNSGFATSGAWLLCFDRMPPWFLIEDLGTPGGESLVAQAETLLKAKTTEDPMPTLFMIFDGMIPNVSTHLYLLSGILKSRLKFGGVNAGSETFEPMPCLFSSEKTVCNGVLGLLLPQETRLVVRHGYPVSKKLMSATSSEGNRIDRIDGRPAFDVYQDVMATEFGITLNRENFYEYAVHFPFGVVTALDVLVRIPVGFNADGSLFCVGEVPSHSLLRLLKAPEFEASSCVRELSDLLVGTEGKASTRSLLTFYCAGRRMHFGEAAEKETAQLKAQTKAAELFGALSLGEFDQDRTFGFPSFHNAAIVCMAIEPQVLTMKFVTEVAKAL